jgi:hypothetical protein
MAKVKRELDDAQRQAVAQTPIKQCATMEKVFSGVASLRNVIKCKCLWCVCFEDAVERIKTCCISTCPCHPYRPFLPKAPGKIRTPGKRPAFGRVPIPPKPESP